MTDQSPLSRLTYGVTSILLISLYFASASRGDFPVINATAAAADIFVDAAAPPGGDGGLRVRPGKRGPTCSRSRLTAAG